MTCSSGAVISDGAKLSGKTKVIVFTLDALARVGLAMAKQQPEDSTNSQRDLQLQLAKFALQLASEQSLSGTGLHIILSDTLLSRDEFEVAHDEEFWRMVKAAAADLHLSPMNYDLPEELNGENNVISWANNWTPADELAFRYADRFLVFSNRRASRLKRVRYLAEEWGALRPNSQWLRFEAAGHRAALICAIAQAIREDGVDLLVQELKDAEGALQHVQEILKNAAAQRQLFDLIGAVLKAEVTTHKEFMIQFRSFEVWSPRDTSRSSHEMPWLSFAYGERKERLLCDSILRAVECEAEDQRNPLLEAAKQQLTQYVQGGGDNPGSSARACFIIGTVGAHLSRRASTQGAAAQACERLRTWIQRAEILTLLQLTPQTYRLSLLRYLTTPCLTENLSKLRNLWERHNGEAEDRMLAFAYVLCYLASAPSNSSFMHWRLAPDHQNQSRCAGIGSHGFRDTNSVKDCGYKNFNDSEAFPVTPNEFDGHAEGRAWGAYLTWASLGAACLLDFQGIQNNLHYYVVGGIMPNHLVNGQITAESRLMHVLDRMDTFLGHLRVLCPGSSSACILGHTLWRYLAVCEQQQEAHRPFLQHLVSPDNLVAYERFLWQAVYSPGVLALAQAEQDLAANSQASAEKERELQWWSQQVLARRRVHPHKMDWKAILVKPDGAEAATHPDDPESPQNADHEQLQTVLEAVTLNHEKHSARIKALGNGILPRFARRARWFAAIISTYLELPVLEREGENEPTLENARWC